MDVLLFIRSNAISFYDGQNQRFCHKGIKQLLHRSEPGSPHLNISRLRMWDGRKQEKERERRATALCTMVYTSPRRCRDSCLLKAGTWRNHRELSAKLGSTLSYYMWMEEWVNHVCVSIQKGFRHDGLVFYRVTWVVIWFPHFIWSRLGIWWPPSPTLPFQFQGELPRLLFLPPWVWTSRKPIIYVVAGHSENAFSTVTKQKSKNRKTWGRLTILRSPCIAPLPLSPVPFAFCRPHYERGLPSFWQLMHLW